ncbi:MAG: helix-turn-helix domain-containing protein [Cytophagales bacterium]|nr:helix-turn-helix domain-containing protein [Cytophagales bacterium]
MDALTIVLIIILCIGFSQGMAFAIILWRKPPIANKYKAMLLLVLSYGLLNQVLYLFGIGRYDAWYHLTMDLEWAYGPLLFLYAKGQVNPEFHPGKKDQWLWLPILIQIICSIYVRSQNFFWDGTRESLTWLGYYGYMVWMNYSTVPIIASLLIIGFAWKSLQLLRKLDSKDVVQENYRWIVNLVRGFGAYYCVVLIILIVDLIFFMSTESIYYFYRTRFYYYPFFIGMALLVYWFGISSIIRSDHRLLKPVKKIPEAERAALSEIADKLKELVEGQQVYRNSELTLAGLAEQMEVKPYLLTRTLNDLAKKSFTDYINEYRVHELEQLVKDPSNDKYTLLSLAHQAGFNSKSSFNRAVKKHLGIPPSQLKQRS